MVCCVTGWCLSTQIVVIGGDTPWLDPHLAALVAGSDSPVNRATMVFPDLCCAELAHLVTGSFWVDWNPDCKGAVTVVGPAGVDVPPALVWETFAVPKCIVIIRSESKGIEGSKDAGTGQADGWGAEVEGQLSESSLPGIKSACSTILLPF